MTCAVDLADTWFDCPETWKKFFTTVCEDGPKTRYNEVSVKHINKQLKPYKGRWILNKDTGIVSIVFEDEAHKAFWLLKWS